MDRLSCLPDDVICHILSFLPTARSVQTSVLSKRWRFFWAHVPSLEFDFHGTCTVNIITQLLLQHNHDIHTFRLKLAGHFKGIEEFESWIVNITTRNVCNLMILGADEIFHLPKIPCLFTCKTLVELCLSTCAGIPVSGIYYLPALKKLKLEQVLNDSHGFRTRESLSHIGHMLSGCPVLEELDIEEEGMLGHCFVSSLTLTRLVLQLYHHKVLSSGLKLDTPGLRYLRLDSFMSDKFLIGSLDSLIEADICLDWDDKHQDHLVYSRNVLAFVAKLGNVKVLTLSTDRIAVIHDSPFVGLANMFHNLTKLDLSLHSNLGFVTSFLENANNLRVFCLRIQHSVKIANQCYWMEPKQVPTCLISHLQTVDVFYFGGCLHEFDMIRYILMNAKVLKMMDIRTRLTKEEEYKAVKRLALFEKGSQECQLVVDGLSLELKPNISYVGMQSLKVKLKIFNMLCR